MLIARKQRETKMHFPPTTLPPKQTLQSAQLSCLCLSRSYLHYTPLTWRLSSRIYLSYLPLQTSLQMGMQPFTTALRRTTSKNGRWWPRHLWHALLLTLICLQRRREGRAHHLQASGSSTRCCSCYQWVQRLPSTWLWGGKPPPPPTNRHWRHIVSLHWFENWLCKLDFLS